jgi:hypothetical protein
LRRAWTIDREDHLALRLARQSDPRVISKFQIGLARVSKPREAGATGKRAREGDMRGGGITSCAATVCRAVIAVSVSVLAAGAGPSGAQASQHGSAGPRSAD